MNVRKIFQKLFNVRHLNKSKNINSLQHKNYDEVYRRYPTIFSESEKFKTSAEKENFAEWCEAIEYMAKNHKDFDIIC